VVNTVEEAIQFVLKTDKPYAMKPWGGEADKAMTYVAKEPRDAVFTLEKWKREGLFKGSLMMQEKVDGVEMGIAGWFGPGGWNTALEESFEHKKFLNDDLGENTGEMGTIIRHVKKSKLFDLMLEPLTDYLHMCKYVGDCSVNCIIDAKGTPWPLEFTMRLGWPDFCIRQEVIQDDPVEWMLGLLYGQDTLKVSSAVAAGVLMTHGDFPKSKDASDIWSGYPIYGITKGNIKHLHFQQVQVGKAPVVEGGVLRRETSYLTAGSYVLVAGGSGPTVKSAADKAYGVAWDIKWPGNVMFRTDVGKRLKKELPLVQKHGFAEGMKYD
jgi:phosphoribosylamine--glycine ligase